ncbi:MAG: signal peptidase I [Pseudomonadota bacterium]
MRRIKFDPASRRQAAWLVGAWVVLFIGLLAGARVVSRHYVLGLNLEPCLKQRLFIIVCKDARPRQGDFVSFRFMVAGDRYHHFGQVFIKRVAGVPGDELSVQGRSYLLNGVHVGNARRHDSQGRPVGHFSWSGRIPAGKYFAMGDSPDSYDSRYWGFVNEAWVIGKAVPIF